MPKSKKGKYFFYLNVPIVWLTGKNKLVRSYTISILTSMSVPDRLTKNDNIENKKVVL